MLELAIVVGLATVISAFCSVAEAVLYSVPWSFIEQLRKAGKASGELLAELRRQINAPISAILTLNTVAHTAGAAVAGAIAARTYGEERLVFFSIIFTVIILVFSEILPKTIGVVYAKNLAGPLAKPLVILVLLFKPAIWMTNWLVRFVEKKSSGPTSSEEDLLAAISLTRRDGIIKPYEERSMHNILTLDKKCVRNVMTPRTVIFSLPSHMTLAEAHSLKTSWPNSRIPVYEDDDPEDIVGLVYRRDVMVALAEGQNDLPINKLMKQIHFVVESMTLDRLLVKFLESRVHLFVVLDEYGGLAGVVTLEDVLEEILGNEIVDETDQVVDMREFARQQRAELIRENERAGK
ncbi:hemolysin family protein [Desulfoplanes sp. PS50]|jgi:CBS domain containing-hemolysin-like protein